MIKENIRNFKLGIFVLLGFSSFFITLYFISSEQDLFASTFNVSARFYNVSGLVTGNNVRFAGVNVGTVRNVKIIDDSSVVVDMVIEEKFKSFIKKNAIASITSDGLMGNKIVNINSSISGMQLIQEGDELISLKPIETDEALRTLNETNDNLSLITFDLRKITNKLNNSKALWALLADTSNTDNIKHTILNLRVASRNTISITSDAQSFLNKVKNGKGMIKTILSDTSLGLQFKSILYGWNATSRKLDSFANGINEFIYHVNNGNGAINTLLKDSTFDLNLNKSIINIEKGTNNFNQDMEGLKESFLLRNYFKRKEKK